MHENDAPLEGREPQARVLVGLILADDDGVRHGQQPHHGRPLDEVDHLVVM